MDYSCEIVMDEPKHRDDGKWARIQEHLRKLSDEMLEWEKEEHKKWGPPWDKN